MADQQTRRGEQWLQELLELMGFQAAVKTEQRDELAEERATWLVIDKANLDDQQIKALIGAGGETIDAVQYLANTVLNLGLESGEQKPFTVELNNYRVQRRQELIALAEKLAQQVRETGQEVEVESLSSAERRQIHTFLQESEDLKTESRGQEPNRRLVVRPRN